MEEAHRIHKDAQGWGWLAVLADWRRSRTRRRLRAVPGPVSGVVSAPRPVTRG